jgi:hypothetical protein
MKELRLLKKWRELLKAEFEKEVTIIFFKSIGGLPNLGLNSRHVSN